MPFSNIFGVSFLFHLVIVLVELAIRGVQSVLMAGVRAVRLVTAVKNGGPDTIENRYRKTPSFFPHDNVILIGSGIFRE